MTTNPQPEWLERLHKAYNTPRHTKHVHADADALGEALAILGRIYSPPQDVREAAEQIAQTATEWARPPYRSEDDLIAAITALITEREAGLRAQLEDKVIEETKEAMALGSNPDNWPTGGEFIARKRLEAERDALAAKLERAREALAPFADMGKWLKQQKNVTLMPITASLSDPKTGERVGLSQVPPQKAIDAATTLAETAPDSDDSA